ncbi:MAG TPA: ribosome small subunit-dependent GTPase A [Firmicutes bacterium]|nr:ribosome small subunit-dependent GTPase A [Candidatus Fermentithermobacillaceae bacterium]
MRYLKLEGRVLSVRSDGCLVSVGADVFRCGWRGRLRYESQKVLAGDIVEIKGGSGIWVVSRVLPRKNALIRPPFANVDQVVVVFSVVEPEVDPVVVDRLLVVLEREGIAAVVCVNKSDLYDDGTADAARKIIEAYKLAGYPVVLTSAVTGNGLDVLVGLLKGKVTVLAGPSGVGKSLLISKLTGSQQAVGELSRIGRGRHTTKWVSLVPVGDGGYLADTPGFQKVDLVTIEPERLSYLFREMAELVPLCRFPRCLHKTEPGCRVKEAVSEGAVAELRYENYLRLLDECLEAWRKRYE